MASVASRIEAGEKRVRALAKEKPGDDAELEAARLRLFADISEGIRAFDEDDDALVERMWRACFLKRIEFFRTRIDQEPKGQNQRQVVQAFRTYIAESMRLLRDLADTVRAKEHVSCRIFTCLGDLARYKESISADTNKRWTEAESLYREAATFWPEAGLPQNQLAVLAYYRHRTLVSAYRYARALACSKPFENARRNLKNLCIELCDPSRPEATSPHERFFDDCLRLFAFVLLPNEPIPAVQAMDICVSFQSKFKETVAGTGIRGEALVALVGLSIFAVTNGDVFSRPSGDVRASKLSLDTFRNVVSCLADKSAVETEAALGGDKDQLSALSKGLFHVGVMCDFIETYGFHLLDVESKGKLEELDRALAGIATSGLYANANEIVDDDQEFAGFLPLGNIQHQAASDQSSLEHRVNKIRRFVASILHNDLKPLSANGELLTTHAPGTPYEDDEEEEILIRPSFSTLSLEPSSQTASAAWSEPARYGANTQLPTFYPFPGMSYGQPGTWQTPATTGTYAQNAAWGWAPARPAATHQPRAPPGFQ